MIRHPRHVRIGNRRRGGLWWRIPLVLVLWILLAAPIVVGVVAVITLRDYAAGLPATPNLEAWEAAAPRTSVIVAADGTLLAEQPFAVDTAHGHEVGHRIPVTYGDLPRRMIEAVLAAEDVRFFHHGGVDAQAVLRAAWDNYRAGRVVSGASTITQQVARNLLPKQIGYERSLRRKVREALLARKLDARYSKQRIFEVYVNHVFLGAGAYGVAAAARAYFDRPLAHLDLGQTALIAGLAQAPGRADPYKNPDAARARRDEVLERMARAGFVTRAEADAAMRQPIELSPPPLRYGTVAPWLTERARREIEESMPDDYARGGLAIETAAQPVLQAEAERLARAHVTKLGKGDDAGPPELAAIIWDHQTGYLQATVGGRSWGDSRFDRATQACRQPGSAFKPILYGAAIEKGVITAGTPLRDAPITEYDPDTGVYWKPRSGHRFRGAVLAQDALALSLNPPAVDVLDRVGAKPVAALARRLGITTKLADVRPMALGASCVIPLELAGAIGAIARGGRALPRTTVVRVRRGDRVLVDRASPLDPSLDPARRLDRVAATACDPGRQVLDPRTAFILTAMMRDVVLRGTGHSARTMDHPAAGKTGTTNDNTDAWFVGFTGRLVAAVWVGHDDPAHTLGPRDEGARAALPLWRALVETAEGDRAPRPLPGQPPPGMVQARVDRETGLLAAPGGSGLELWFAQGTEPTEQVGAAHDVPTNLGRVTREF